MSLNANDLSELVELWEELNLSSTDNLSHVETVLCSGAISHASFLHVLSVLYVFIFVVGLGANGLVVWVNLQCDRKHQETHLYILNLAVADLCVVVTLPVWVASLLQGGRWPFGEAICKVTHLVFSVNLFSSIFFLTCMSVDRYLTAMLQGHDSNGHGRKVGRRIVCTLVWLLALAASMPDTHFLQTVKSSHGDAAVCRPVYPSDSPKVWMVSVQLTFFVLGFAVPLPIITIFYLLLAAAIPPNANWERRVSRRIVLAYIVVFVVCWLPFHAVLLLDMLSLLGVLPFTCWLENFLDVALHLTQCFSLVHCCINPALYNFLSRSYRYDLMKAFIFKYSTKTGLTRLIDSSHASETECSAVMPENSDAM